MESSNVLTYSGIAGGVVLLWIVAIAVYVYAKGNPRVLSMPAERSNVLPPRTTAITIVKADPDDVLYDDIVPVAARITSKSSTRVALNTQAPMNPPSAPNTMPMLTTHPVRMSDTSCDMPGYGSGSTMSETVVEASDGIEQETSFGRTKPSARVNGTICRPSQKGKNVSSSMQ